MAGTPQDDGMLTETVGSVLSKMHDCGLIADYGLIPDLLAGDDRETTFTIYFGSKQAMLLQVRGNIDHVAIEKNGLKQSFVTAKGWKAWHKKEGSRMCYCIECANDETAVRRKIEWLIEFEKHRQAGAKQHRQEWRRTRVTRPATTK